MKFSSSDKEVCMSFDALLLPIDKISVINFVEMIRTKRNVNTISIPIAIRLIPGIMDS